MGRIRALIVDDEPLARSRLRELLVTQPDVEVAGECGNGREAIAAIRRYRPDLVYLDVQMPEVTGSASSSRFNGRGRRYASAARAGSMSGSERSGPISAPTEAEGLTLEAWPGPRP